MFAERPLGLADPFGRPLLGRLPPLLSALVAIRDELTSGPSFAIFASLRSA